MKYEYEVLKIGDADAILIRHYVNDKTPYVILIDAGNVEDWKTIKSHLRQYYGTYTINLAICTHPDNDHMGGFFGLLEDKDIKISEFWLIDPAHYLDENDIKRYSTRNGAINAVRKIFDNPNNNSQNLIDILLEKDISAKTVISGSTYQNILRVVAPTADYYREVAKEMITDCNVHSYVPSDTSQYDEAEVQSIDKAKSSIDECNDDPSPYNKSSIVILYEPGDGQKILFTGDACCASLCQMIEDYPEIKDIDLLKVPHHGSKHNLSSHIIETLNPKTSYISAKGSRTHPCVAIVNYLSKHGNVFSTHKCSGFIHRSKGIERAGTQSLNPLKARQNG